MRALILVLAAPILVANAHAQEGPPASVPTNTNTDCFSGKNQFGCSIRATNDTKLKEFSQPASFAYTANYDDETDDSFAIMAALKVALENNGKSYGLKTQWHKNNQQTKEQDDFKIGGAVGFSFSNVEEAFDNWIETGKPNSYSYYSHYLDFDISYNRKGIFGDKSEAACVADPSLKACNRQNLQSARISTDFSPWDSSWQNFDYNEAGYFWSFAPTVKLFHDEALNSNVETLDGTKVDGSVTGIMIDGSILLTPAISDYNWGLTISGQLTQALDRSSGRKDDFGKSEFLYKISMDYALGKSFVEQKTANTFLPAIGITYTNGADPLNGKADQETLVLAFKLKY